MLRLAHHLFVRAPVQLAIKGLRGELAIFQARFLGLHMDLATYRRNFRVRVAKAEARGGPGQIKPGQPLRNSTLYPLLRTLRVT
jgi:hypothetical protein